MGPENSVGIEIIQVIGVGFFGHVRDVALVPAIFSRVFPKSRRSSNRDSCLTTPDRRAAATDYQTETQAGGSPILGGSFSILVAMAFGAVDRETGHRYRLAPSRFSLVLDLEGSTWTAGAAMRSARYPRTDSRSEPRQCVVSAQNPQ